MSKMSTTRLTLTATVMLTLLLAVIVIFFSAAAKADDELPPGNKIHFSITETETVSNDTLSMTFNHVAQGATPQLVANEINKQMQAAAAVLKQYPTVITQTSQYNIYPVYKKQLISHWRGQQSLTITLENKPGLVKILAKIQPYLAYKSMSFGVSEARQQQIINQLTSRAIQAFRAQANRIAQGFHAPSYRILETHINTPNRHEPRPLYSRAEMAMAPADMAPPTVAAGQSKIRVQISGTILIPH